MAESLHTPGPWAIDLESKFTLGGDTRSVEALTPDGKMVTREVCTLMFDSDEWPDGVGWQEDVANAVLIRTAPKLLAAAEQALAALVGAHAADDSVQGRARIALREAIAEATTLPQNAGYGTRSNAPDGWDRNDD